MKSGLLISLSLASLTLAACGGAPHALRTSAVSVPDHKGYLDKDALKALSDHVPAPPLSGTPEEAADRAQSQSLRQYESTDRWLLATSHAEVRPPYALQHFDCALGVRFAPDQKPSLTPAAARIFERLFEDAEVSSSFVKHRNFRARPVGDDADRIACQTVTAAGRASASYPSGSATVAAAYGEAVAAMSPEDAVAARRIGREIAISRAVCGMHYPQDVRTGITLGETVFEQASHSPAFQADLQQARIEIAALKANGKTSPACAAERLALSSGPTLD